MDDEEVFSELLAMVQGLSATLAAQIRAEVARGRTVSGSEFSEKLRRERGIGSDDMAVAPYTDDEAVQILCRALLTTARAVAGSRKALRSLIEDHDVASTRVRFTDPHETGSEEQIIDLDSDLLAIGSALDTVTDLLSPFATSAS